MGYEEDLKAAAASKGNAIEVASLKQERSTLKGRVLVLEGKMNSKYWEGIAENNTKLEERIAKERERREKAEENFESVDGQCLGLVKQRDAARKLAQDRTQEYLQMKADKADLETRLAAAEEKAKSNGIKMSAAWDHLNTTGAVIVELEEKLAAAEAQRDNGSWLLYVELRTRLDAEDERDTATRRAQRLEEVIGESHDKHCEICDSGYLIEALSEKEKSCVGKKMLADLKQARKR